MINRALLARVARKLEPLGFKYAFVGGSIVEFLIDHPDLSPARPTEDLDLVVEVVSGQRYSDMETVLRQAGFVHDTTQGAPLCRWRLDHTIVDIMPTENASLGLNTAWFKEALATATPRQILGVEVPLISAVAFIATKLAAFTDRGDGDYYGSHDLEDVIAVIDGRASFVTELAAAAAPELKAYVVQRIKTLTTNADFQESLPGHLPPDTASQNRLPLLRDRLKRIAAL